MSFETRLSPTSTQKSVLFSLKSTKAKAARMVNKQKIKMAAAKAWQSIAWQEFC